MKTTGLMLAVMLGCAAGAGKKSDVPVVVACIDEGGSDHGHTVAEATAIATRLFQTAGVKLEWHTEKGFCKAQQQQVIQVSLSMKTPKDLYPGAFASALVYEGVHIQVYFDRLTNFDSKMLPHILAYVLVHEIAHILQGVSRHSESGIMKAVWDSPEHWLMRTDQLRFADEDVKKIHEGLTTRAARQATQSVVADRKL